ncbi:MAG: virulence factor [Hyphomicrobiaceae bacterium]
MATLQITYWRDIPALVTARQGRKTAKRELPIRFTEAIDRAAMRSGAHDSDAYLADWRQGDAEPCDDDLEAVAEAALARLLESYDDDRLVRLVAGHGREDCEREDVE